MSTPKPIETTHLSSATSRNSGAVPTWAQIALIPRPAGALWVTQGYHYPALVLTWIFARLRMSPNAVTIFSGVLSTLACALMVFWPPTQASCIAAFFLAALGYASDCSDGQLARVTNRCSRFGAWLDHLVDTWKMVAMHMAIGWLLIQYARQGLISEVLAFLSMFIGLAANSLYFFGWNYKVNLLGNEHIGSQVRPRKRGFMRLPLQIVDHGLFVAIFLFLHDASLALWTYLGYNFLCALVTSLYLATSAVWFPKRG